MTDHVDNRAHPDATLEAVIETLRRKGPLSARSVLHFHPELKDTVTSTRTLKGLVDQGYLQSTQEEGRNTIFGVAAAPSAATADTRSPTSRGHSQNTAVLQADLDAIAAQARATGEISIADAIGLFSAKREMSRGAVKHRLRMLVEQGRLQMIGRKRNAKYRPAETSVPERATSHAPTPLNWSTLPCARALLEAVQAERRMYAELLAAALGSPDQAVRRLAFAANGMGTVVDGLME